MRYRITKKQKPRFDLNAALNKALKESKNLEEYDQRLNEISARLEYDRISERADMQIRFNRQNYGLSRMITFPWELGRARVEVERSQLVEKSEYKKRVIREDCMIDVARILARESAIQNKNLLKDHEVANQ